MIGSRNVVAISICRAKLTDFDGMTSWDTYFLTREMANHRAKSLICILWWKKAGNLERGRGLTVSGKRQAGM